MQFIKKNSLVSFNITARKRPENQSSAVQPGGFRFLKKWMQTPRIMGLAALLAMFLAPNFARACACGCGVFEVGDLSMFPEGTGGMFSLEYDYQKQYLNYSGTSRAPAENNDDKKIETSFITADFQYMFNRSWGVEVEVPYAYRSFTTASDATGGNVTVNWGDLGDIRLKGIYTGFFADQSAGINFGLKLPTGSFRHEDAYGDVDRDTQIGTGSTDVLLGGFYRHKLTSDDQWRWFTQLNANLPAFTQDQYRPGFEIDGSAGVYYNGWDFHGIKIRPVAQVIVSERTHDSGANSASPVASGYQRILLSPGIEFDMHPVKVNAQIELPVYEHVTGNQLVAPALFKLTVSYMF
jgi:hypothetical protein